MAAAHDSGLSVGAYLDVIRPLAAFGMPLPRAAEDALHLVRVAGRNGWTLVHTHERFQRFTPLGVTLDYPHDAVPDGIVHWQDLLALTVHLEGHAPAVSGAVTADHLARAASQLDETPARVRDRLRRYAPLFALTFPQEETLG
ncbi:hypothetical protein [Nonomuraea sp. NPDC050691]|uniref:wHTH domain-containing protein n=1 Tax=Nonomuraea sp. NPDC050691 TaxID=3155661 RepID=UPI003406A0CF